MLVVYFHNCVCGVCAIYLSVSLGMVIWAVSRLHSSDKASVTVPVLSPPVAVKSGFGGFRACVGLILPVRNENVHSSAPLQAVLFN